MTPFDRRSSSQFTQVLLPVSPLFMAFSLFVALALNFLPWGSSVWVPDWLALVLVFWSMHQPHRLSIGAAFAFGLCMDVHEASLLGEHALAYSLLSYAAIALHRRVMWFRLPLQMLHVLPMLLIAQAVIVLIRLLTGAAFPGHTLWLESVLGTLLWPLVTWLLLAPQRRPPDKDATRPL